MPFKTITVTKEAYDAVKALKRPSESFSELFLRMRPVRASDLLGRITPEEGRKLKETIARNRKESLNFTKERIKRFG